MLNELQRRADDIQNLHSEVQTAQSRNSEQDQEVREFEKDLNLMKAQSSKVEKDLLNKLSELSDQLKLTC